MIFYPITIADFRTAVRTIISTDQLTDEVIDDSFMSYIQGQFIQDTAVITAPTSSPFILSPTDPLERQHTLLLDKTFYLGDDILLIKEGNLSTQVKIEDSGTTIELLKVIAFGDAELIVTSKDITNVYITQDGKSLIFDRIFANTEDIDFPLIGKQAPIDIDGDLEDVLINRSYSSLYIYGTAIELMNRLALKVETNISNVYLKEIANLRGSTFAYQNRLGGVERV